MQQRVIEVGDGFWNIRGSFRIAGLIDVGTQASLVRLGDGRFVFLDACELTEATLRRIETLTGGGKHLCAILNVHPFHTLHASSFHTRFPRARLYGTERHQKKLPELPWEPERTETAVLHKLFAEDFEFSVPAGVDFISADENVHFSSVLVWHPATRTIHVDDTLMYVRMPLPIRWLGFEDSLRLHPTLSRALQRRPGAAAEFRDWASDLAERWRAAENLCAAHVSPLLARDNSGATIHERIVQALANEDSTLSAHTRRQG